MASSVETSCGETMVKTWSQLRGSNIVNNMDMYIRNGRAYNIPYHNICKTIEEYMEDDETVSTDRNRFVAGINATELFIKIIELVAQHTVVGVTIELDDQFAHLFTLHSQNDKLCITDSFIDVRSASTRELDELSFRKLIETGRRKYFNRVFMVEDDGDDLERRSSIVVSLVW